MRFGSHILAGVLGLACTLVLAHHLDPKNIDKRTAPVGQVYKVGDKIPNAASTAGSGNGSGARSGKTIVQTFCASCHGTGAAGAPKMGNKDDWAPRLAKGTDTLVKHATEGFNAMPPKGLCMDCSNEEIRAAVEYLIAQVK